MKDSIIRGVQKSNDLFENSTYLKYVRMTRKNKTDVQSSEIQESSSQISIHRTTSPKNSPSKPSSPSRRNSPQGETSRIRHLLPLAGARKGLGKQEWAREIDFPLAGNAVAVDLTNIAHISYLVCKFGGIAFFVPCLFFIVTCAFPLLYMENIIGQSTREGLITMWKIVPLAKGIPKSLN